MIDVSVDEAVTDPINTLVRCIFPFTEAVIQFERETYSDMEGTSIIFVVVLTGATIQTNITFRFTSEDRSAQGNHNNIQ